MTGVGDEGDGEKYPMLLCTMYVGGSAVCSEIETCVIHVKVA